jgi:hypothetical protein
MRIEPLESAVEAIGLALVPGYATNLAKAARKAGDRERADTINAVRSTGDAIYVGTLLIAIGRRGSLLFPGTTSGYAFKAIYLSGVILTSVAGSKLIEEVGVVAEYYSEVFAKLISP